jgi:hypothetical protein
VYLTGFVTSQGLFLAKVCAAARVVSLPVLIAGFAAQDKLVQGLSLGAVNSATSESKRFYPAGPAQPGSWTR